MNARYECKRDPKHPIREADYMVTCPTCLALYGRSTVTVKNTPTSGAVRLADEGDEQ